jgi:hypothetical protein
MSTDESPQDRKFDRVMLAAVAFFSLIALTSSCALLYYNSLAYGPLH